MAIVKQVLIEEEEQIKMNENTSHHALKVQKKGYNNKQKSNNHGNKGESRRTEREDERRAFWCYACGKKNDHIARNCPKVKEDEKNEKEKEKQASVSVVKRDHIALCMKRNESQGDGVWVLDCAASDCMTNRRDLFTDFLEMNGSVAVGDGTPLRVQGQGNILLHLSKECGGVDITFSGVLYVPDLEDNLISVGQLEEKGLKSVAYKGRQELF